MASFSIVTFFIFHTDLISKICADYFLQSQSKNNIKSSKACSVIRLSLLNRNCYMFYLFVLLFIEKNTWKITNTIVYYQLLASITIFQIFFLIFHDGKFILWTKQNLQKPQNILCVETSSLMATFQINSS